MRSCFVIIGYGKKTSYANGKQRELDLEETFSLLIKPVFDALRIPCYRAIDKNTSGSIDAVMLREIKEADLVVADLSTLNANVMWELGVRHALKERHTIMICEKEQMASIPFDVGHFVVHQYAHSEEGIRHKEVDRFQKLLKGLVQQILSDTNLVTDSPVFTFLNKVESEATASSFSGSFAEIMKKAEDAKNQKDYETALTLFTEANAYAQENMTLKQNLPFIVSRQTLCTYKSKKPTEEQALQNAWAILSELNPENTQDIEVLGLSGAIKKRLSEITNDSAQVDSAIHFYERGFTLKQDHYNGINAAFMLYKKACLLKQKGEEWQDVKLKADYLRLSVLEITLKMEQRENFLKSKDDVWVLFTIAEAYHYKNDAAKMTEYEGKAGKFAADINEQFSQSSYNEQKKKISDILECLN
jgi:tetratricopeptide (TPR) repeat protein